MRTLSLALVCNLILILSSCNDPKQINDNYNTENNSSLSNSIKNNENNKSKKFVFMVITIEEPMLEKTGEYEDAWYSVLTQPKTFAHEIKEYENFTEDDKYKLMDELSGSIDKKVNSILSDFHMKISTEIPNANVVETLYSEAKSKTRVTTRDVKVYNTYKDASISRNKY